MIAELAAKPVPGPVQARLHAAERDTGDGGDLPVAESFEVGEVDDHAVPFRQGLQGRREVAVKLAPEYLVLG